MKTFFRYFLMALVLLVVAISSALITMTLAIHGGEVAVPDLVGKTAAEARKLTEANALALSVENEYYSPKIPQGRILSQLPSAGMKVRRGWQVRIAESLGPQRVVIPNVLQQSERAAEMNIQRRGLDLGAVAQIPMAGVDAHQVLSQSPPPDASDISAPKISLLVSTAPQPQGFVMPSFIGQPVGTATQTLQDAGFKVGNVMIEGQAANTGSVRASPVAGAQRPNAGSIIVAQTPAAGDKITLGAAIDFQVRSF
jgi:eukaryotic-like serine/threonine-protein kinase